MPKPRLSMRKIKEILRLKHQAGLSHRQIGRSCGISHATVATYLERAEKAGLSWPLPDELDEDQLQVLLFGPAAGGGTPRRPLPDLGQVHAQLKRKGVTLQLLWEEYRAAHPQGYSYTQFCAYYRRWKKGLDVPLRQTYRAGEKTFVDWGGQTIGWMDSTTGQPQEAFLFIAVLGASNYTFAEAFINQQLFNWIEAHIHAFEFFGGVSQVLIPDNVRTGVSQPCYYEPQVHPTYEEMATHYATVVLPTRPYAPRDKAKVESAVQHAQRRILAAMRDQTFFGIGQINAAIQPLLDQLNARPFQKMHGSRLELFETLEKAALTPLPPARYQVGQWKKAKANIDYHIQVDWHFYSVPYTLAQYEVEVRLAARTVEIFHKGRRVALHPRSGQRGKFTTDPAHRPKAHQKHLDWTPSRLISWAQTTGPYCAQVVAAILESKPHPEQGYRACLGLMRLARDYGTARMEAACHRALILDSCTYKSIASMLKTKMDQQPLAEKTASTPPKISTHANLRGAPYYQREETGHGIPTDDGKTLRDETQRPGSSL